MSAPISVPIVALSQPLHCSVASFPDSPASWPELLKADADPVENIG
jgi:hypothetical protein